MRFFDVFREQRNDALVTNGLNLKFKLRMPSKPKKGKTKNMHSQNHYARKSWTPIFNCY